MAAGVGFKRFGVSCVDKQRVKICFSGTRVLECAEALERLKKARFAGQEALPLLRLKPQSLKSQNLPCMTKR